jgi:hypothetical protein
MPSDAPCRWQEDATLGRSPRLFESAPHPRRCVRVRHRALGWAAGYSRALVGLPPPTSSDALLGHAGGLDIPQPLVPVLVNTMSRWLLNHRKSGLADVLDESGEGLEPAVCRDRFFFHASSWPSR